MGSKTRREKKMIFVCVFLYVCACVFLKREGRKMVRARAVRNVCCFHHEVRQTERS